MRVLVVEDEQRVADLVGTFLASLGHQPRLAPSAEAALAALDTEEPESIILDLILPGMSGLDFLRVIRARDATMPIVAISGAAPWNQARECFKYGVLEFLAKPLSLDLLGDVMAYVAIRAAHREHPAARQPSAARRSPRPRVAIPVRVTEFDRPEWHGTSVDLSVFGMKIRPQGRVEPGPTVLLSFVPPDAGSALQLLSVLVRADPDGVAYRFTDLSVTEFDRLRRLVDRLSAE